MYLNNATTGSVKWSYQKPELKDPNEKFQAER